MGLTSNTGLLASVYQKQTLAKQQSLIQLKCEVTPAPFMLRPYAGLYNPFSSACSVLCNHPADNEAKEFVKRAKDNWFLEGKTHYFNEDLTKFQDINGPDKEKIRTPHDIVTEDMFRRYTETDSRPLTPAPTLASGKSRGSRRCLTPDQPHHRTTIVLDLRRSHSQETLYYHGYATSEATIGHNTSATNERSTLPSLNLSEGAHNRLVKGQCEQLPPLASPLVLSKRAPPVKELTSVQTARKLPSLVTPACSCSRLHLAKIMISYHGKSTKRGTSSIAVSMTAWGPTGQRKRMKLPNCKLTGRSFKKEKPVIYDSESFFKTLENQLKALKLEKSPKSKNKETPTGSQRSKVDKETNDGGETVRGNDDAGESRRRGKRRRKGRHGGSDRLTSAGLAAQTQQDPETQIAGIGTDSQNPSSRGSVAALGDDVIIVLPVTKTGITKKTDSFLDDDILKYLHREVDEEAIETEFDIKRRYVLEEALRTRPERQYGEEMQNLLRELKVPAMSLGDWLHIPRVFSRQNAQFALPIDSNDLETLTPMNYAARFVTLKKSKQLLYLTVLRKFRPEGYRMPIQDIEEGLILMMGGILNPEQASNFKVIMSWENYIEEENIPDEIKLTLNDGKKTDLAGEDNNSEVDSKTLKYRTWCGLCAICERMYGRFPPRDKDSPDGMELSDFTMIETKLTILKVHDGLKEILNAIRER